MKSVWTDAVYLSTIDYHQYACVF